MNRLRTTLATSLISLLLLPAAVPAAPAPEHDHDHAGTPAATAVDQRFAEHLQRMRAMHKRMQAATPAERRRLMSERMELMHEGMALMHSEGGMAGGSGMCHCAEMDRRLKVRQDMLHMMLQLMPNERLADGKDEKEQE